MMEVDTLIVGGGLAGLYLADTLHQQQQDYLLLEARPRLGGRIETRTLNQAGFDVGPSWFWPQLNPRLMRLAGELGVAIFPQYQKGGMVMQSITGYIHKHAQSWVQNPRPMRFQGGVQALILALAARLNAQRVRLSSRVLSLEATENGVIADYQTGQDRQKVRARRVVLALPPRLSEQLGFAPQLPVPLQESLRAIPTWMASHAKVVAVYDRPFWRDQGLSGLAISQCGPLAEIHDASPATGEPGALFGFMGWSAQERASQRQQLESAIIDQLTALFGSRAAQPRHLVCKDWAEDTFTAVPSDILGEPKAPDGGVPQEVGPAWSGRIWFVGSEVAQTNGGYLEGALESVAAYLCAEVDERFCAVHTALN